MLKSKKTRVSTWKRVYFRVFSKRSGFSVLGVLALRHARSSLCIANGENSKKSNHMLSATSHVELEIFRKFLICQFQKPLCQRFPLQKLSKKNSSLRWPNSWRSVNYYFRHADVEISKFELLRFASKLSHSIISFSAGIFLVSIINWLNSGWFRGMRRVEKFPGLQFWQEQPHCDRCSREVRWNVRWG